MNWVLKTKTHRWFDLAAQRLGVVLLQQKNDAAINALNTQVEAD